MTEDCHLGQYKYQNVYARLNADETWSLVMKHSYFGELVKSGFKYKPKIGMARRYFRKRIRRLNESQEKIEQGTQSGLPEDGTRLGVPRATPKKTKRKRATPAVRVTRDEILRWIGEIPGDSSSDMAG